MPFPPAFLEEVKNRNPIDGVISRYVELKRSGSNLHGLCPFHSERTPSFTVYPNHFHCFGCGAGGDVITFVMRMDNMSYAEAVRSLAERAGIPLPDDAPAYVPKQVLSRERNYELNKAAARIFYENLVSPAGEKAREYLDARELSRATRIHFGLGFALDSYQALTNALVDKGFTIPEIKAAFLCGIGKNGKPYDLFRNRIIFPIIDTAGHICAFGGRVMDASVPKYLNSADTPVFKKSKMLFALNFAKNIDMAAKGEQHAKTYAQSGEIILCEGYMDVISLHQAGFSNAVATLGTAITQDHARILKNCAKRVYLCYDSDEAGKKATAKAIRLLGEVGLETKVVSIPGAKDPDEYIKKHGALNFTKILKGSSGQIDYRLNDILKRYDLTVPEDKLAAVGQACDLLSEITPDYKREIFCKRLSELTGVTEDSILIEVRRRRKAMRLSDGKRNLAAMENALRHYQDRINPDAAKFPAAAQIEQRILGMLMLSPEYLKQQREAPDEVPNAEDFLTDFHKQVFGRLVELYESGSTDLTALNEFFTPEQFARIETMQQNRRMLTNNTRAAFVEQVKLLREEKMRQTAILTNASLPQDEFAAAFEQLKRAKLKDTANHNDT